MVYTEIDLEIIISQQRLISLLLHNASISRRLIIILAKFRLESGLWRNSQSEADFLRELYRKNGPFVARIHRK